VIKAYDGKFFIHTASTSYIFRITASGHPEQIYYGPRVSECDVDALALKNTYVLGSSVEYSPETPGYSLDSLLLEYSGIGKGDCTV
jgi:alpha-galactosidase